MKKWLIAVGVLVTLTVLCIYLFIPAKIVISKISAGKVTIGGEIRFLSNTEKWEKWWRDADGRQHEKGKPFTFNSDVFNITGVQGNAIGIQIEHEGMKLNSVLELISFMADSTGAVWQVELPADNNPVTRVIRYKQGLKIWKNMAGIMQNFTSFLSNPLNIYGMDIQPSSTNDTLLLSARYKSAHYPSTTEIYGYLDRLKENISKQKATVTGYPMVYVKKLTDSSYETQIALPTSLWLKDNNEFFSRRMVKGNFMFTEVKGGPYTVDNAAKQLDIYTSDYNKTRMAIPFQQYVTNRLEVSDTSKWITHLFMPVIE